jgi:DNA polymerase-3 subunit delta'
MGNVPRTMTDLYARVVGQERVVAQLRAAASSPIHAYLLVGPPGSGKRAAAVALAAAVVCPDGEPSCTRRVASGSHPDVTVVERAGPYITVKQAEAIARAAALSPSEGTRRVLILVDFHLVEDAAPALLKTIEEPPPSTVFIVLADYIPPELVTIASRCATFDFGLVGEAQIEAVLVTEGVDPAVAAEAAQTSGGRLDRARTLATDPLAASRRAAWQAVPARLDGTGATAAQVAAELQAIIAEAGAVALEARHAQELAESEERAALTGERVTGRKELDERHRREQRRLRTDELRYGLAVLEGAYRDRAARGANAAAVRSALDAVRIIQAANKALERNPNEGLLLQALMVRLAPPG